ncbi:MAG: signal peptidase I [Bacillota bacterium]
MPQAESRSATLRELAQTLIMALLLALVIKAFVVETVQVDGPSMEPTLVTGQRLFINKVLYHLRPPATGDIVVFRYPSDPSRNFIKRAIAAPGQTVEIREGVVWVDEKPLHEPYVTNVSRDDYPRVTVPPGRLFVLGDNRANSDDSRSADVGLVPLQNLKGKAFVRFWPLPEFAWMGR